MRGREESKRLSPAARSAPNAAGRPPIQAHANPFDVSGPYAALMRAALILAVLPGLGIGLVMVLVFGLHLSWAASWPQLAQAHGQIQTLGFTLLYIAAVGLQLFPRFLSAPLTGAPRALPGGLLVGAALLVRLVGQPLETSPLRMGLLIFAAVALPLGAVLIASTFHGLTDRSVQPASGPAASWRLFAVVAGASITGALILSIYTQMVLALGGPLVPQGTDEALIHLELVGFATSMVLAVGSRIFGRFLLLQTHAALEKRIPVLTVLWGAGVACVCLGWLSPVASGWLRLIGSSAELIALLSWLWLIGLYRRPARSSGTPYVTNPTRRWIRVAFGFLLVSIVRDSSLFASEALLGSVTGGTDLSAARHALAQGFLLPLMVTMAARLLPIYSADVLRRKWLLELIVDLLLVGAFLRVAAEMAAGYAGPAGVLVALGGTTSVLAFTLFSVGLWSSLGRLPKPRRTGTPLPVLT